MAVQIALRAMSLHRQSGIQKLQLFIAFLRESCFDLLKFSFSFALRAYAFCVSALMKGHGGIVLPQDFDNITLEDIDALIISGASESPRLEFKRELYGRTDSDRREFAADVSAFANAAGGDLIIGVSDEGDSDAGAQLWGVETADADALVRRIIDFLRSAFQPQIIGIRVRWIPMEEQRGVLLIRVPRSWQSPHRATACGGSHFYVRTENGKHQMSVDELRHAFLRGDEIAQRMRKFRQDRLALLEADEGPLPMEYQQSHLVLHFLPYASFAEDFTIDLEQQQYNIVKPLGAMGWSSIYSLDGLVKYSGPEYPTKPVRAFTTLFRSGVVEFVERIAAREEGECRLIDVREIESSLLSSFENVQQYSEQLDLPKPVYVALSILRARGLKPDPGARQSITFPYRRDRIVLPEISLGHKGEVSPIDAIRSVCDLLWNAFGKPQSPNFNRNGDFLG